LIKPFLAGALAAVALAITAAVAAADLPRPSPSVPRPAASPPGVIRAQADLTITAMAWSSPPVAGQRVGQTSILNLQVRNQGRRAAAETRVSFRCRRLSPAGACPAGLSGTLTLPALNLGASIGLAWPSASGAVWTAGSYRIDVRLDPRNTVAETSETNNSRRLNFTVALASGAPRLAPKQVTPAQTGGITPQPESTGKPGGVVSPIERKAINPQPEPPGITGGKPGGFVSPTDRKAINPQPEPPGKPGGFVPAPMSARPSAGAAPFTPKVATAPQLTISGRASLPFKPKTATAATLTISGLASLPFVPKTVNAAQLTITGRTAAPFVPKSATSSELTITGRPQ